MSKKTMILMVVAMAAFATAAFACPPCDELWTGTHNCTPQDRFTYCCLQTDQCPFEGEGGDEGDCLVPTPEWQKIVTMDSSAEPRSDAASEISQSSLEAATESDVSSEQPAAATATASS